MDIKQKHLHEVISIFFLVHINVSAIGLPLILQFYSKL